MVAPVSKVKYRSCPSLVQISILDVSIDVTMTFTYVAFFSGQFTAHEASNGFRWGPYHSLTMVGMAEYHS